MSNTIYFVHKALIPYRYIQLLIIVCKLHAAFKLCFFVKCEEKKKEFITNVKKVIYCNDLFCISEEEHYLHNRIILTKEFK